MNTNVNFVKQKCQKKNITSVIYALNAEIKTMTMNSKEYLLSSRIEDLIWEWEQANISQYEFIIKLRNLISDYE